MQRDTKLDPRYAVVAGAWLTQFMVIGLLFSYSIFFKTFEDEFGWSRTTLSAAASLAILVMGVLAGFMGHLGDRFGASPVLAATGFACGLGFALISQVAAPWHLFLIFGGLVGLGMSSHDVVTLSAVARTFERRRGLMTGLVKLGTASGQMLLPLAAAFLIAAIGWRPAAWSLGLAAALFLVVGALLMKAPGASAPTKEPASVSTPGLAAALRSRAFWTLCAIQFFFLPSLTTIPLHLPVHGMDLGMDAPGAASLLSIIAAASVAGRLAVGASADRIGGKMGYVFCFIPLIASLLALLVIESHWWLFVAALAYGFSHGGFFTIVAPTIAEYFGTRAVGALFGVIVFFGTVGGAIGPLLAGRIFDTDGSYAAAFAALAGMSTLGLALVLSLPRADSKLHAMKHEPRARN